MKKTPEFQNEDEERDFWAIADSTDYVDWSIAKCVTFPNLVRTESERPQISPDP